jgi:hypothetical protein
MNIKYFFHKTINYYDDSKKLVSEYSFAKDTLHKDFESFEKIFDAATSKNFEIFHCDNPFKLFVGFMVMNDKIVGKSIARHFMRLGAFKRAGMLEKMVEHRHKTK